MVMWMTLILEDIQKQEQKINKQKIKGGSDTHKSGSERWKEKEKQAERDRERMRLLAAADSWLEFSVWACCTLLLQSRGQSTRYNTTPFWLNLAACSSVVNNQENLD